MMSKSITAVYTLFLLHFTILVNAQLSIAHVVSDSIIPKMESYQLAMSELQSFSINLQKQFEGKEAEIEVFYMDIIDKKKKGVLAPKDEKDAEAKLQKLQADLQKFAQEMEVKLMDKEKNVMTSVYDEYNNAIKEVCNKKGYAYILDKKLILYSDGGIDVTDDIKASLKLK